MTTILRGLVAGRHYFSPVTCPPWNGGSFPDAGSARRAARTSGATLYGVLHSAVTPDAKRLVHIHSRR